MSLKWPYLSALSRIFYPNDNSWYCIPKMVWFKKNGFFVGYGSKVWVCGWNFGPKHALNSIFRSEHVS